MFAEMTLGPNHTLVISRTGPERDCCILYRQQEVKSEKIRFFSKSKSTDPISTKSTNFITRLKFCFKDRTKMEQREPTSDPIADGTEGSLRDLASKWFLDTQVPLIVSNGLFPSWFLGFITRKDAEEILREKELGCFLIRLSDRAIGYILSYRGKDRCRHFVINQSETGQFVVCGDTEGHNTVPELIDYYHTCPIEPFGEYLTSSCFEVLEDELYDMIQVSPKERLTVPPVKNKKQQIDLISDQQPTRLLMNTRTKEELPPLPRRSRPHENDALNDQDKVLYAQLRKQKPREIPKVRRYSQDHLAEANSWLTPMDQNTSRCSSPSEPESVYSELSPLESKSKSLPLLDSNSDGDSTHRLSKPSNTPPRLSPKPGRPAARCSPPTERTDAHGRTNNYNLDFSDGGVYHLAGRAGGQSPIPFDNRSVTTEQEDESVYAEVASESLLFSHDNTYEILPDHKEAPRPKLNNRTPETVEDNKRNNNHTSRGLKNDKWKWFFPEGKKKW